VTGIPREPLEEHAMNTHDDPANLPGLDLLDAEERRELLNAYIDGELSAEEALHVSLWLDDNPGALRVVEHLRHIDDLLGTYADEPVPADFAGGVLAAVGVGRARREGRVLKLAWYRRPLASAAAVLIAVGATVFVMQRGSDEGQVVPQPTTDVVSVLQNVPADELDDLLLNADVLLSVDDAALEEGYDDENVLGG